DRLLSLLFSSRRHHTSSYGDWSSDVCSSDLSASEDTVVTDARRTSLPRRGERASNRRVRPLTTTPDAQARRPSPSADEGPRCLRSEERRVGEGGGGWWVMEGWGGRGGEAVRG